VRILAKCSAVRPSGTVARVSRRVAAAAVLALLAAGCGGSGNSSSGSSGANSAGAKVFADAGCKNCHTLKAAGASGTVGPSLDQLQPSEDLVIKQVNTGGGVMPSFKGKLTPAQIKAVAQYVSSVAGKS
jgi:mono/diheme cytochrome c family protein